MTDDSDTHSDAVEQALREAREEKERRDLPDKLVIAERNVVTLGLQTERLREQLDIEKRFFTQSNRALAISEKAIATLTKERDDLKAEVEQLRERIEYLTTKLP